MAERTPPPGLPPLPLVREGGKYPVPTVGDRALGLYRELHAAACEQVFLPPYCAVPTRANRDQGVRALVGDRVLVVEFDPNGRLVVRSEPLEKVDCSTDK